MKKFKVICENDVIRYGTIARQWDGLLKSYGIEESILALGEDYALSGKASKVSIDNGKITAKAYEKKDRYEVEIDISHLSDENELKATKILKKFANEDYLGFNLKNDGGVLLPKWEEVTFSCSCDSEYQPCRHIVAVWYLLGEILQKCPLICWDIRGIDYLEHIYWDDIPRINRSIELAQNGLSRLDIERIVMSEIDALDETEIEHGYEYDINGFQIINVEKENVVGDNLEQMNIIEASNDNRIEELEDTPSVSSLDIESSIVTEEEIRIDEHEVRIDDGVTTSNKVNSLFKYIEEINKTKQKLPTNLEKYTFSLVMSRLHQDDENIKIFYRDRTIDEDLSEDKHLLMVHKPEFEKCPNYPKSINEWLERGWDNFQRDCKLKEFIRRTYIVHPLEVEEGYEPTQEELNEQYKEYFIDIEERIADFKKWRVVRDAWAKRQRILDKTRSLFTELYKISVDLSRDAETIELIVANGFISDTHNNEINHPIVTKRVGMSFDADSNTIYIDDLDVTSDLYSVLFQTMEEINLDAVRELTDELVREDYHPLDRNDLPLFLKVLIHRLSSDSEFIEIDGKEHESRLKMKLNPCFILRKKLDGSLKAIERIIETIEETDDIPKHIAEMVDGGTIDISEDVGEETIEERLAAVGGESVDILLSKAANKEQLEIAKRIKNYNAVLVQGPPGTGKTHTIANLLGNFLAEGKSVLVTSQTTKALSVLKEKVAPELQNLCVSLLDDSNADMEKSVEGITSYMSNSTSFELKNQMNLLEGTRKEVIEKLATTRKRMYDIIHTECNSIVINGEEISPSKAAKFVSDNVDTLSYIPGKVKLYSPLPLREQELITLYESNDVISRHDEDELSSQLPNPAELIQPADFEKCCETIANGHSRINEILVKSNWAIRNTSRGQLCIVGDFGEFEIKKTCNPADVEALSQYCGTFKEFDTWMINAAVDGNRGSTYKERWLILVNQIQDTCSSYEKAIAGRFGKEISISDTADTKILNEAVKALKTHYQLKSKVSSLDKLLNKSLAIALDSTKIDGHSPETEDECELILNEFELKEKRKLCANYWDSLMASGGMPLFSMLDVNEPEMIAKNSIETIKRYLSWFENEYEQFTKRIELLGAKIDSILKIDDLDSDSVKIYKIVECIRNTVPDICEIAKSNIDMENASKKIEEADAELQTSRRATSKLCGILREDIRKKQVSEYRDHFAVLYKTYEKYNLLEQRETLLNKLDVYAHEWASAIKERKGIHGYRNVPSDIKDAWTWKQYAGIIEEITQLSFDEYQEECRALSNEYKKITAEYAAKSAWYHLLKATEADIDMKQALQGWAQTVKRIGKGTGKNAPMYKAKARELMSKCQNAVPAWIMPISKALESLDPRYNKFDIVIIDEASQSDISSLAILFMGKKLVIVGDDKQVSPMAIGIENEKIRALQQVYLKDKIPNYHLYDLKTSIYDIAATTFQPLMLKEHFRCVPEIIGFSNYLSYDNKIKPLRDASSSNILPAVVNYRVSNGRRIDGKINPREADTIVAIMKSCFEMEEYAGKSFGIISLLGDEQVNHIQQKVIEAFDAKELASRNVLCGNASNFQGDERDVIILSMVDSSNGEGPLPKREFGVDDAYRKRYNVATSRARDQLWVVHSLDAANDLKPGDIRKTLLDYSKNPSVFAEDIHTIENDSESPFEKGVALALHSRGYKIVQQWEVGAYRIDMVVVCGSKRVAIECDGEKYHSGDDKIREDMERQTILERLGWRFIRIRGSEYFSNPDKTIERVVSELDQLAIYPENNYNGEEITESDENELLSRVKVRIDEILNESTTEELPIDLEMVEFALNSNTEMEADDSQLLVIPSIDSTDNEGSTKSETVMNDAANVIIDKQENVDLISEDNTGQLRFDGILSISDQEVEGTTEESNEAVEAMTIKSVQEEAASEEEEELIRILKENGVHYVDNRNNGGELYLIGGRELIATVKKCWNIEVYFDYRRNEFGRDEVWKLRR